MRSLTDVFALGTAPLPEGLRTLQVSPGRIVEPGQTVHANFTFRNLGGGTATGFRVRFRLPEGLTYLVGTARIDEQPVDEQGGLTSLLQPSGAQIGEVPAGGERRISLAYSVAPTIENGTQIALQAAISSFEVPAIGSNVVRLVVRSRPTLQNSATRMSVTPMREIVPGAELQLKAQIHNSGQSSAHDVIVLLPVPANTSYVAGSARVDGRAPEGLSETEPFGLTRPSVIAKTLGPGAMLDIGYRVRIDPTLEDQAPITATGAVCTQELPEFALAPVTLKIPSAPSFASDDTSFRVDCEDDVVPGQRLLTSMKLRNVGTARARGVKVKVKLPKGVSYTGASRVIDGAAGVDRDREAGVFELGDVEPGRSVEVQLAGVVRPPIKNGTELPVEARIEWSKGEREFARTLTVRSSAAFPAAFNRLERESSRRLSPGDTARFTVHLENMGGDAATDGRLYLEADPGLQKLKVTDADGEVAIADDKAVHLDRLDPNVARKLNVEGRIAPTMEDEAPLRLRATLRTAQLGEIDLGSALHVVASRARFSAKTSHLVLESSEVLRPGRTTACKLTVHNEGTDRGRDVRVRLQLPEELRLESVDGAARAGDSIAFGDVAAQATGEATVHLRLVGIIGLGDTLEVGSRLSGINVVPFALAPMQLSTHAEPAFSENAALTSLPSDAVDSGEKIEFTLALRNSGDGSAKRINVRFEQPTNSVYAPGSTTINEVPLLDFAGTSPLLASSGLSLGDVGAGVEVILRLWVIANTPLPVGSVIETSAHVTWDDQPEIIVRGEPLRVRSAPALPIVDPDLPFSVLDAAAGPIYAPQRQLGPGETGTYLELPSATPVRGNGRRGKKALAGAEQAQLPPAPEDPQDAATTVWLEFTDERLTWTLEYLERAKFEGLVGHLMVMRALFPDHAAGREATAELRRHGEVLNELVDRLFIKLRLPGATLVPADLETREYRASLIGLVDALRHAHAGESSEQSGLRLVGTAYRAQLAASAETLAHAKLVTAAPWGALAALLGTSLQRGGVVLADFGTYRDGLLRALGELTDLSPTEFEGELREPADDDLEVERETIVRALTAERPIPA
jgi:uncharacterized repeat protein (TIGR01451 family)